jgi:hypothetical protein
MLATVLCLLMQPQSVGYLLQTMVAQSLNRGK